MSVSKNIRLLGDNVRSGTSLQNALTTQRLNAIMDSVRGLARGDNVNFGSGFRRVATADGYVLVPYRQSSSATTHPFQIINATTGDGAKIRVRYGHINNLIPTINSTAIGATWPELNAVSGHVYIAVTVNNSGLATAAVIVNGETVPADSAGTAHISLGTITVSNDAVTAINQSVTHSLQYRRCGVSDHHFWAV